MAMADGFTTNPPLRGGTSGHAAMNTPSPLDWLLPLMAAAQRSGMGWPTHIDVTFSLGGKVSAPIAPAMPIAASSAPDLAPLQIKIMAYLNSGPKRPAQVREKTAGRLYEPRGINELIDLGLVEKLSGKFRLTDLGSRVADDIDEGDDDGLDH
jgi:hypothetical protein